MLLTVLAGFGGTIFGLVWYIRRKSEQSRLAEEARVAAFVSGLTGALPPAAGNAKAAPPSPIPAPIQHPAVPANGIALQKLLFEAAHKAGEAGEPALAIQLYARLLARYPATAFARPAQEAVEAQKKRLLQER